MKMLKRQQRSSISVLLIIVCLCTLVFTSATASPQSGKRIDLSAGKAGQALIIPQPVWANLNSFVFLIGFDFFPVLEMKPAELSSANGKP